jgi:hypothetical protein
MGAIDNFRSLMNKSGGFARLSRYEVELYPPAKMPQVFKGVDISTMTQDISMLCDTISMPGHDLQTQTIQYGSAPETDQVTSHGYAGQIVATFYADADLTTKMYFDAWQQLAVNPATHKANYYKDYIGSMEIYQLSAVSLPGGKNVSNMRIDGELGPSGVESRLVEGPAGRYDVKGQHSISRRSYGIEVQEVYPATIGAIEYAYATVDEVAKITVQFNYRKWKTLNVLERVGRNLADKLDIDRFV